MAVPLGELKSELELDVDGLGYATHIAAGNMTALADTINLSRTYTVFRGLVLREELLACLNLAECEALTASQLRRALYLMEVDEPNSASNFNSIFEIFYYVVPSPVTAAGLNASQSRTNGSRAEFVWGAGTVVLWQECEAALALP